MSVQSALDFIRAYRDSVQHDEWVRRESIPCIQRLLETAREMGFDFSEGELREAHQIDWKMRLIRFR